MKIILFCLLMLGMAHAGEASMKTFDVKAFQERLKKNPDYDPNDEMGEVHYLDANGSSFEELLSNAGYSQRETPKDGPYLFYRQFSKRGKLQMEGVLPKLPAARDVWIGEHKTYSFMGLFDKSVNHDQGFKILYPEVLEICKKQNIDLNTKGTTLSRSQPGKPPLWYVEWTTGTGPAPGRTVGTRRFTETITIDGVTGAISPLKK